MVDSWLVAHHQHDGTIIVSFGWAYWFDRAPSASASCTLLVVRAMSLAEGDRLEPAVEALLRTESWRAPAPAPPAPFALPLAACAGTRRSRSGAVLTRWLRMAGISYRRSSG